MSVTRVEVLLQLGEPARVIDGERLFVYQWDQVWFVNLARGHMPLITERDCLWIEFDPAGNVLRHALGSSDRLIPPASWR